MVYVWHVTFCFVSWAFLVQITGFEQWRRTSSTRSSRISGPTPCRRSSFVHAHLESGVVGCCSRFFLEDLAIFRSTSQGRCRSGFNVHAASVRRKQALVGADKHLAAPIPSWCRGKSCRHSRAHTISVCDSRAYLRPPRRPHPCREMRRPREKICIHGRGSSSVLKPSRNFFPCNRSRQTLDRNRRTWMTHEPSSLAFRCPYPKPFLLLSRSMRTHRL